MNADLSTPDGAKLKQFSCEYNFQIHISQPTRITDTSSTCLDQILSNFPNFVLFCEVLPPVSTNDHHTVGVHLRFSISREMAFVRHIWLYAKGDFQNYRRKIQAADWDYCFHTDNIDLACQRWTDTLLAIAKESIPNKDVLVRPNDKPWYNNSLRAMKRKLMRVYKKAKKNKTSLHWGKYKLLHKEYLSEIENAIAKYRNSLNESLSSNRNNKKWWQTVKSIIGKGNDDTYPPLQTNENEIITDSRQKANAFNKQFLLNSNLDTSDAKLPNITADNIDHLDEIKITPEEVHDYIKHLDSNKASGVDGISPRLLKEAGTAIVPSLTRLINMSLSHCKMPRLWKRANIVPIHKKGAKSDIKNYRPISLLPIPCKVLEKAVFKNVYNYLHKHKILTDHQSGFRPNDSSVNQLAYLYHQFCLALDQKKDIRLVFCDITKAFDRVWYEGIIYKLQKIGIVGSLLDWFRDYLTDRYQRVMIRGQCSDWGEVKAGVPQGSVIGPLLFLIYINDLTEVITCDIKLYADDTSLYINVENPEHSAALLNENLAKLNEWANKWLVTFNPQKTKSILISNKHNQPSHPPLILQNTQIDEVQQHKHLGIIFNNKLNWNNHIESLIENTSKLLDVMYKIMYQVDRKSLETIYFTFIRPKLEYAHIVWSDCSQKNQSLLEKCQLRAARIVTGAKKGTSHTKLYDELSWPTLSERRDQAKLLKIHNIIINREPLYLYEQIPKDTTDHSYNLRREHLPNFRCRTTKLKNSFLPSSIDSWNNLPTDHKSIKSYPEFKKTVFSKTNRNKELYYFGNRKQNIIHSQLRLNCSNLNDDLFGLHVTESWKCFCCDKRENAYHFFMECPLYQTERAELFRIVKNLCDPNLNTFLYGNTNLDLATNKSIFEAVQCYIENTHRFF